MRCSSPHSSAIAVALAPAGGEAKKRTKSKQARPNIVLIMDDDQSVNLQRFLTKTNAVDRPQGRHLRQLVRQLLALLPVALDDADRAVRAQPRGAGQQASRRAATASSRRRSATPCRSGCSASGYYTAHIGKFLNGYGRTVAGHGGPARLERVVRLARQPRRLHRRDLHGLRLHAQRERPASSTTAPRRAWSIPATYQTDVYSQKAADFIRRRAPSNEAVLSLGRAPRSAR